MSTITCCSMKSLSAIKMSICLEFLYYIFLVLFIFDLKKGIPVMKLNYNKFNTEKKNQHYVIWYM